MVKRYSGLLAGFAALPVAPPEAGKGVNAVQHIFKQRIVLNGQASGDIEVLARLPNGHLPIGGWLITDTSLGTSTIAIGNATDATKYKAAAVQTVTNTKTLFGDVKTHASDLPLTADEEVLLTIGTAALPVGGNLWVFIETAKASN